MRTLSLFLAFMLAIAQLSCGRSEKGNRAPASAPEDNGGISTLSESQLEQRRTELAALMRTLVANPSCDSGAECRSVAFGYKACGGPEGYHVYSIGSADEPAILARAREYTAIDRRLDELRGQTSDCMLVLEPSVACQSGQCVASDSREPQ